MNEVPAVSPSCSLTVPFCRYTSYLAIGLAPGGGGRPGDRRGAVGDARSAVGWPGAPGGRRPAPAGCSTSVVSEYGGSVWLVAVPAGRW